MLWIGVLFICIRMLSAFIQSAYPNGRKYANGPVKTRHFAAVVGCLFKNFRKIKTK